MGVRELTESEAKALEGTRHETSRVRYPIEEKMPYYQWLRATLKLLGDASAGWLRVHESDQSGLHLYVAPGVAKLGDEVVTWTGGDVDVSAHANETIHVWATSGGGGDAAVDFALQQAGWPSGPHIPLAIVALGNSSVASIDDRRTEVILHDPRMAPIADLDLTISDPPTQGEVQAVSDKVDEVLAGMRSAGLLRT